MQIRRTLRSLGSIETVFGIALILSLNAFVIWFVHTERRVFFWDDVTYWLKFEDVARQLQSHPLTALHSLVTSVRHEDYNDLAVWPLAPIAIIFGPSRLAYSLAVLNVYLIPACASFLLIGLADDRQAPRSAWLAAAFVVCFSPFLWNPVLSGFLDVGGLIIANVVLGLCWRFPLSQKRSLRLLAALGFLLAMLPLFRRWYSFWSISFLVTTGAWQLWESRKSWPTVLQLIRNLALVAACYLVTFLGAAGPLAMRVLHTNYGSAYSAYRLHSNILTDLSSLGSRLGVLHVAMALGGIVAALITGAEARRRTLFLVTQWVLIFAMFTRIQDFNVHHSYLLMQLIVMAQVFLVLTVKPRLLAWVLACVGMLSFGHAFVPSVRALTARLGPVFPGDKYFPERRPDLNQLIGLRNALLKEDPEGSPVYVLASSNVLNSHTVKYTELSLGLERRLESSVLWTQSVDKSVGVPAYFFSAKYVVVADPIQYHLRPEDQRVVGRFAEELLTKRGIGQSYVKLSDHFLLEDHTNVYVYRKAGTVPQDQIDTLRAAFESDYPAWPPVKFDPPG